VLQFNASLLHSLTIICIFKLYNWICQICPSTRFHLKLQCFYSGLEHFNKVCPFLPKCFFDMLRNCCKSCLNSIRAEMCVRGRFLHKKWDRKMMSKMTVRSRCNFFNWPPLFKLTNKTNKNTCREQKTVLFLDSTVNPRFCRFCWDWAFVLCYLIYTKITNLCMDACGCVQTWQIFCSLLTSTWFANFYQGGPVAVVTQ